jgi:hypothetical protein
MREILEAPVPFLIGMDSSMNSNELPLEIMRVNLDTNKVLIGEVMPKLSSSIYNTLLTKLRSAINFTVDNQNDQQLQSVDQAFNLVFVDPEEVPAFDHTLVRDAMLEFMTSMLHGYEKLIVIYMKM